MEELNEAVHAIVRQLNERWTSVGVIVPDDSGLVVESVPDGVTVVSPPEAKGLEFDAVVVVEPAKFVPATGDEHAPASGSCMWPSPAPCRR